MPDLQNQLQNLESMVRVIKGVLGKKGDKGHNSTNHYHLTHNLKLLAVPPEIDVFDEVNLA